MMNNNKLHAIELTKKWLIQSVIGHNFCPYAKQPFDKGSIGYQVYAGNDPTELIEMLARICMGLDNNQDEETTLLIVSHDGFLVDFHEYLAVLDIANHFLETPKKYCRRFSDEFQQQHIEKVPRSWFEDYQLASFHPQYVFADAHFDDRENYTNRSPFPIFHVLRNASIDAVRMNDSKAERIVERNCEHIRDMALTDFQTLAALSKQS